MNQEFKEKWVAALRSGDYEQGLNVLKTEDDKYCCLGVACDLLKMDGLLIEDKHQETWYTDPNNEFDSDFMVLPGLAVKLMDVVEKNPLIKLTGKLLEDRNLCAARITDEGTFVMISQLNDWGYTFPQIADIIEEQL